MLLNTIKIPKNLQYLTDRLPKPTYLKKTEIRLDHSEDYDNRRDQPFLPTISKKRSHNKELERHGRSIEVVRENSVLSKRYDEEDDHRSSLSKHSKPSVVVDIYFK